MLKNKINSFNSFLKLFLIAIISFSMILSLSSCGESSKDNAKGSKDNPVKIGVVGASDSHWIEFKKVAQDNGIYVDLKDFAEYTEPNPALAEGQLDMNEFQHILFLAKYNSDNNNDLTPIGATAVFPISLYGALDKGIKSVDDLKKTDSVAIPNDGTNQSRAILLLVSAGLVKLYPSSPAIVTPAQIDTDNSIVNVLPVSASETPATLNDPTVKAAIVNNDFVSNLGELNASNKLFTESAQAESAKPYINVFVTRSEDKDNEVYNKLAKLFLTDKNVREANISDAGGENNIEFLDDFSSDELLEILKQQSDIYKSSNNDN